MSGAILKAYYTLSKATRFEATAMPIKVALVRVKKSVLKWKRWKQPLSSCCRGDNLLATLESYAATRFEKDTAFPIPLSCFVMPTVQ